MSDKIVLTLFFLSHSKIGISANVNFVCVLKSKTLGIIFVQKNSKSTRYVRITSFVPQFDEHQGKPRVVVDAESRQSDISENTFESY
jgi:hypothetical protein